MTGYNVINLLLNRSPSRDGATVSPLYCDGALVCFILEDVVREVADQPVEQWKIPGRTAIPAGTYRIEAVNSPRFGPDTLSLVDVPGFQCIRIHGGNDADDTEGCLLPGTWANGCTVGNSRDMLARIKHMVLPELQRGGEVWIEIT
jgi:hypothetical protein